MNTHHYLNITHDVMGLNTNKTSDDIFIKHIRNNDIICLSETHYGTDDDISFDGYSCFKLCRKKNKNVNRYFGGIAILYKTHLKEGIKFLSHKNDDYVWVKLSKTFFGLENDHFLCYAYIPPENSPYYQKRQQDTLDYIESDIQKYSSFGSILLCGDLNARTGIKEDFVSQDENSIIQDDIYYDLDDNINQRKSEDKITCSRGTKLLEICISAKLRILNGRKLGDSLGKYTCHKSCGSSVNDYLITQENILKNIPFLQIDNFHGHISDHCSLSWALITSKRHINVSYKNESYPDFPTNFKWDITCINKFQNQLSNESSAKDIKSLSSF